MAVRAVLDVNVLVSGVHGLAVGRSSPPVTALVGALAGEYALVASPKLLDEFHTVLLRPRFALGGDLADRWANLIGSSAEVVRTRGRVRALKHDPADNEVLECALRGRAGLVVTGNTRHFAELKSGEGGEIIFRSVRILTPREFVDLVLKP